MEFFLIELEANAFIVEEIKNLPQLFFILDERGEAQPLMTLGKEEPAEWKLEESIEHEIFYMPRFNLSARAAGRPAARIFLWASLMSYSIRKNLIFLALES